MVHSWAVFTLASFSVCPFFCLSRPVMHCSPSSGLGYSKTLQLHYLEQYRDWKVLCLACSPTAGQYFQRLCDCSAFLEICLHFPCHPSRPKRRGLRCLSSPVSHNVYPPSISNNSLAHFSQWSSSLLTPTILHFVSIFVHHESMLLLN